MFSPQYDPTQHFSPTFVRFADSLVQGLVDRYAIRNKRVLEIGCGKGEFLQRICAAGDNAGLGVDPSYDPNREVEPQAELQFLQESYTDQHAEFDPDWVCCRHTFEHIRDTGDFLDHLGRSLGGRTDRLYFFEVPDATRILTESAFWDVYYEHCNYFTPETLAWQFQHHGFEVLESSVDYDRQYVVLVARWTGNGKQNAEPQPADSISEFQSQVKQFNTNTQSQIQHWQDKLAQFAKQGPTAIWGGASKGVAFLTTLGVTDEVAYAIDVNPHKRDRFMPGSGHKTIHPDDMTPDTAPTNIVLMNPVYQNEVQDLLTQKGIRSTLTTIV